MSDVKSIDYELERHVGETCTLVAKSSWKKNISMSSFAFSLRSELASEP